MEVQVSDSSIASPASFLEVQTTYCVPSAYVRTNGADGAAFLYGLARSLRDQKRKMVKGSRFRIGLMPAISFPIGKRRAGEVLEADCLSNAFPWACDKTYRRRLAEFKRDGLVVAQENPSGRYARSEKLGHLVRTPDFYTMPAEVSRVVLDGRKLLHFNPADAIRFGNLNDALGLNRVQALFEFQRRDFPDLERLKLTPASLEEYLRIKAGTSEVV
jgi:hypothetical protein